MLDVRCWTLIAILAIPSLAHASWTQFALPNLSQAFGGTAVGHLGDGRYVYGESGNLYLQDAWNNSAFTAFTSEPAGIDPSFIAVGDDDLAVLGQGGFSGFSSLFSFDPDDPSTTFVDTGITTYNYNGVFRDAASMFVSGASFGATNHHIRYLTLDGAQEFNIINDVSTFSAGMAADSSGNLFVGDNDDGSVYMFSKAQLDTAIGSMTPLGMVDGTLIHDFGIGGNIGSLAVDEFGQIWAAGWAESGIKVFNPNNGLETTYIPGLANANYKVATFTKDSQGYVAFMNQGDPSQPGTSQIYGFDLASNQVVPEPGTIAFLFSGFGAILYRRSRRFG